MCIISEALVGPHINVSLGLLVVLLGPFRALPSSVLGLLLEAGIVTALCSLQMPSGM